MAHRDIFVTDEMKNRFWEKVKKTETCWIWRAFKNKQGYGRFGIKAGECVNASRVSWTMKNGSIPEGLFICHTCDNPSCVNPDHLFAGSRQDNINDMMIKKRSKHFKDKDYYGVRWEERYDGPNRNGRWHSFICIDGKMQKLAAHTSVLEAARNYDRIAYIKYGIRDRLNFPEEYNLTG